MWQFALVGRPAETIDEADIMGEGGFNVDFATEIFCERLNKDAAGFEFEGAGNAKWRVLYDGDCVGYVLRITFE